MLSIVHQHQPSVRYVTAEDPIKAFVQVDGGGGTVTSETITLYAYAEDGVYDSILVTPITEDDVDWQVSRDGSTWGQSISLGPLQGLVTPDAVIFYAKAIVANDGSVPTGIETAADFQIEAREED